MNRKAQKTKHDKGVFHQNATQVSDNKSTNKSTSLLQSIINYDISLTRKLSICADPQSKYGYLRPVMVFLEYSCHAVPWLFGLLCVVLFSVDNSVLVSCINLCEALILDLIVSFVLKSTFRRKRPSNNRMDMLLTVSVDKFSFPSGHCTRAGMLTAMAFRQFGFPLYQFGLLCITWAVVVAVSRVLLGRHHVSDVIAGLIIGVLQHIFLVEPLWLTDVRCEPVIELMHQSKSMIGL